ncbi:MAG: hypothetical protein ACK4F9_05300 [Brevinematia bacterium]
MFGIPIGVIAVFSGFFVLYVYFFKYKSFLKLYKDEYDFLVSRVFDDAEVRKVSIIESIFKGMDKDEFGVYRILSYDEFGDLGKFMNILLTNVYNHEIEKSRLLSYQKEVINKLLGFIDDPVVIIRRSHRRRSNVIVGNLNLSFLKAIKPENAVRLATKLFELSKIKQSHDKYLYDSILDIIRSEEMTERLFSEGIEDIFLSQDLGIEEFLVDIDWFFHPIDDRSKNVVLFLKELVKGNDLMDIDRNLVLDVLSYDEYRKSYSLPDSIAQTDIIPPVAPDDENTFIAKKQELFYHSGVEVADFKFLLGVNNTNDANEPVFNSSFVVIPATSKHFSPEKMLILYFKKISVTSFSS